MTIDIISAAQADRQIKLDRILALQLDVIEIDAFIAKARSYAGEGETETDADMGTVSDDGVGPAQGSEGGCDAASTEPNGGGSHETLESTAQDIAEGEPSGSPVCESGLPPVAKPKTRKQIILDAHKAHPDWWAEKIADETDISLGTVRSYISGMSLNVPGKPYQSREAREFLAAGKAQEALEQAPALDAPASEQTQPAPSAPAPLHVSTRPVAPQPKNTVFRLRNAEGLYLAADLNAMLKVGLRFVTKTNYPWQGSERQMAAVRKMLPETVNLREEVISNA